VATSEGDPVRTEGVVVSYNGCKLIPEAVCRGADLSGTTAAILKAAERRSAFFSGVKCFF